VKTFLTAIGIVATLLLVAMSGNILGHDSRPSYDELVTRNNELTWQLKYSHDELEELRQDEKDGLVPCGKGQK